MESTDQKGLACLPALVYSEGLLPLLSVNEVLRLRRVCKQLKSMCDDHIRKKCHSKSVVRLRDYGIEDQIHEDSLSKFLEFDSTSSIKIPSQHFYLDNGMSIGQLSLNLSTRYGTQIKHLSMKTMELPFVSNSSEFHFFQNIPNLSSLTLGDIIVRNEVNDSDQKIVSDPLPTCFKNNIRKFEVAKLCLKRVSEANIFWKTVGLFEKLECFQFPRYSARDHTTAFQSQILENCCKLIGTNTSNINCLDLQNLDYTRERSEECLKSFSEQCLRNKIKWKNVPAWIVKESLYKTAWSPNRDLIVSMTDFYSQNAGDVSFPNLVSLQVNHISVGLQMEESGRDWSKIPEILSPSIYPALRTLNVTIILTTDNKYFSVAWQYLTNLEEVSFKLNGKGIDLTGNAFLGDEDETQQPPFLRLKKLKKLSFHIPRTGAHHVSAPCSIGHAFHKAFRLMPLKEFKVTSDMAIESGTFDKDAILALCSPGPFIENIEKFPFRNWSMKDVTDDEFQQLGRMFPNNQAL